MKKIAVVGSGISGLSAAWLLSKTHQVTLLEKDDRLGGHSNTTLIDGLHIDTGFIVYNVKSYPNLIKFFQHLGVETQATDMSFSLSKDKGQLEYNGQSVFGMFAQKSNFFSPSYWGMLADIVQFYNEAPQILEREDAEIISLGQYLEEKKFGHRFIHDHLIPMGAAIWSTPAQQMLEYPAASFVRFCQNHGLLQLTNRPEWRTVVDGSQSYVSRIAEQLIGRVRLNSSVRSVTYGRNCITIECRDGFVDTFDDVVFATHADQALSMISEPTALQAELLSKFKYSKNLAVLHSDPNLMPKRKSAWASWNYISQTEKNSEDQELCLSYWMNRLHRLKSSQDYFVTLNPLELPQEGAVHRSFPYEHPLFDRAALEAQKRLWELQGQNSMWFCGSYFGYGFHEDGLQAGLAVAEQLGDVSRPWHVDREQSRIHLPANPVKDVLTNVA